MHHRLRKKTLSFQVHISIEYLFLFFQWFICFAMMPAQSTGSSIHVSFQLVYFAQRLVVVLRFLSVSSAAFAMLEICRVTLV